MVLTVALAGTVAYRVPVQAAVPALDNIRVAIFMELPGKYTLNTPSATLSGAAGLDIGFREPGGTVAVMQTAANEQTQFMLDDYKVRVAETTDLAVAAAAYKRLQTSSGSGMIQSLPKNGKIVYQVLEGSYTTAALAQAALEKWSKDTALSGAAGAGMLVTGPHRLEAGSFGTLAEAREAAQAFGAAGIDAFPAVKPPSAADGQASYSVLVGAAASETGLDAVKTAAAKITAYGSLNLFDPTAGAYLRIVNDHTISQSAKAGVSFALPQEGTKVWVSAAGGPGGVKLTERYNRTYRGAFEISGFNKRLAVINELPFEQYLYSVVGGEMPASWPAESLKAQAVAARTYALYQGFGFKIAHVVDSVLSQAYGGIGYEKEQTIAAVDATKGEVMLHKGKLIEALFSSSAGGATADAAEIWGNPVAYLTSVPSSDEVSEKGLYNWYRVALPDSRTGYIREDLLAPTGSKTLTGLDVMSVKTDGAAVRPIPLVQSSVEPVTRLNTGTRVAVLEKAVQSNEMSWVRGPFSPEALLKSMSGKSATAVAGPVTTLEVGKRGVSGRVTELLVNGRKLDVKTPDTLRSALGGLPSTRFQVDETGRYAILGGSGAARQKPDNSAVYAIGADGKPVKLDDPGLYIMSGKGTVRAATKDPSFRFTGTGYGHGVGLSQWGARSLADAGYDYQYILKYYYNNVTISKDGR
ncbi:stage II sporulation protein SpoIID [Paenibacillus sambharensis]|uniref:Stage II sporulation protein SpoIID n=2 Tax=Paenibacillus sambharensis TaxID=1803190 RepID=A0A2W1L5M4_9BACL|nr:stage II sporulation protein SpoIID [Paenibacillus sambharensis]